MIGVSAERLVPGGGSQSWAPNWGHMVLPFVHHSLGNFVKGTSISAMESSAYNLFFLSLDGVGWEMGKSTKGTNIVSTSSPDPDAFVSGHTGK